MKKTIKISLILFSILCMVTTAYAASCSMSLQIAKDEFDKNEELVVDVVIDSISDAGEGIIGLGATLEYDKNSLTLEKMEGQSGWATPSYNEANGVFVMDRNALVAKPETAFKMTFKVKDTSSDKATITLKNITASGGIETGDIPVANATKTITIKGGTTKPDDKNDTNTTNTNTNNTNTNNTNTSSNDNNDNNDNNNNNNDNNNNNSTNSNTANNASQNSNSNASANTNANRNIVANTSSTQPEGDAMKKGILPKAGTTSIIVTAIAVLLVLAVIFYIKMKKIDKKMSK